jgi:chemotaxis protein methyltransferase CheR
MTQPSVTNRMPEAALAELSGWIAREFGLHYPRERWPHLEREISAAAVEADIYAGQRAYLDKLLSRNLDSGQREALIRRLTVAETYFFREPASLEAFAELALPKIASDTKAETRSKKIWSAGCASGEEPYSIAMLLHKLRRFDVEIVATDLNAHSLRKAFAGIYTDWSFRGTPPWVKQTHFQPAANNTWQLTAEIRKMVTFAHVNLLDASAAPRENASSLFDVIFCRNVLMYLTPQAIALVVARFHQRLAPGGWLIVGVTETSQHLFPEFEAVHLRNATLYRKSARAAVANYSVLRTADISRVCDNNHVIDHDFLKRIGPPIIPSADTVSVHISSGRTAAPNPRSAMEKYPVHPLPRKPADAASILTLARQKAGQADLHSALALCEQALRADRMTVAGYYLRALILQELGLPTEATQALHQSIYLDPEFILGHFALGNLALHADRRKESKKHFENVLLLLAHYRPEDTVPHSEGLAAGRLREIVISAGRQGGPMKARAGPSRGNFDLNT